MTDQEFTFTDEDAKLLEDAAKLVKRMQAVKSQEEALNRHYIKSRDLEHELRWTYTHLQRAAHSAFPNGGEYRPEQAKIDAADLDGLAKILVAQRDEAVRQYERVKTLVQLAVGEKPGERILELVAELQAKLEAK